jgi:hypothetical protein
MHEKSKGLNHSQFSKTTEIKTQQQRQRGHSSNSKQTAKDSYDNRSDSHHQPAKIPASQSQKQTGIIDLKDNSDKRQSEYRPEPDQRPRSRPSDKMPKQRNPSGNSRSSEADKVHKFEVNAAEQAIVAEDPDEEEDYEVDNYEDDGDDSGLDSDQLPSKTAKTGKTKSPTKSPAKSPTKQE